MAEDSHHEELIAEIARNREQLAAHRAGLRRSMDVRGRLQHSFQDNAGAFLGTAAVLGALLALIPSSRRSNERRQLTREAVALSNERRRSSESKSLLAVLLGLAGKIALDMGKPIVLKVLREHYLSALQRAASGTAARTEAEPPR